VRIIAGEKRGHRISAPKGVTTRPTSDFVRETAFNLIGPVDGAAVLDVFAGSGALGLEALSRGAARATFVDSDRDACRTINANLDKLKLHATVLCQDALRMVSQENRRYDLVLCDPPYDFAAERLAPHLAKLLEPTRIYRAAKGQIDDDGEALPLDVAFVLREGQDVTLISWGAMVKETLAAADELAGDGIRAEVIDLATLKPYDADTILASVQKTGRCVIVHEAARTGGFGAEIAALIAERGLTSLLAPVVRVTGYDTVIPLPRLEQHYMPSVNRIAASKPVCNAAP